MRKMIKSNPNYKGTLEITSFRGLTKQDIKELERKMPRPISVEEVKKLALKYYEDGGDGVVECWEDYQILDAINNEGMTTEAAWLSMFNMYYNVTEDIRNS